jgi:glycosyltransferase involved in cell wall biosynthesis
LNETGCHIPLDNREFVNTKNQGTFNILWVGRFIPTKLLGLALQTIKEIQDLKGLTFHIVGDGIDSNTIKYWYNYAALLGIQNQCKWHGQIAHKEVQILMRKSNLLFFTSIVEGTSHVVLESISNSLPILCFDTCGHGEIVTSDIGRKIPLENPNKSIMNFAKEIENLYLNRNLLEKMSKNCKSKSVDLSWYSKGNQMIDFYKSIV